MASININTGKEEIEIVRDGEKVGSIFFSPSDFSIMNRLKEIRVKIQNMKPTQHENIDEDLEEAAAMDKELRDMIDYAFDYPCSDIVFGKQCSFTTSNGASALEQFLEGAIKIIQQSIEKEAKESAKRQEKYLKGYKK